MDPLYKVGDTVLIKSAYDPNCTSLYYRFNFTGYMLHKFGGEIFEISDVRKPIVEEQPTVPDDGYLYRLKGDNMFFSWASSMFEPEF